MLCWNRLLLSKRCLHSYLETIGVENELFVVDNASTDATGEWVESLRGSSEVTDILRMQRNDPATALNEALERCTGEFLHIMENDYHYLPGWDDYVLDRFARIPDLGQLALVDGYDYARREHHQGLVFLARDNVCTTSVLRREVFFEAGVRVNGHYLGNCYPDDYDLSTQILRAGWRVAWSDVVVAHHIGLDVDEQRRDPGYYARDYALKLFSPSRLLGQSRRWARLDFYDTTTLIGRLVRALRFGLRRRRTGPPR